MKIKVLVCRVGAEPVVEEMDDTLEAGQAIVHGWLESWSLGENVYLICNEEGRLGPMPDNRPVRAEHWTGSEVVRGDFFLVSVKDASWASLSNDQIVRWSKALRLGGV